MSLRYKYLWLWRVFIFYVAISILAGIRLAVFYYTTCACTKEVSDACKK